MESLYRAFAVLVEVILLMAILFALFRGVKLAAFDFGMDLKYKKYIGLVMTIISGLALIFFAAHLITFYPRISF